MIIKLIPGQRIALAVAKTEQVEGNYGPQIKFSGSTPDDHDAAIFLNVETAQQQLGRIGLTLDSVIGHTVEIERVEKNGRKFTNINKLGGAQAKPSNAKQPFSSGGPLPYELEETGDPPRAASDEPSKLDGVLSLHDVCVMHSAKHTKDLLVKAGFQPTAADILAAAATQMIGAQKVGASV